MNGPPEKPPKPLRRRPAGRRPQYFSDPATDKLMSMVLVLAQELSVTRDRLDSALQLLADRNLLPIGAIDAHVPDPAELALKAQRRAAFLHRLFQAVEQEREAVIGKATPPDPEEILRVLS